MRGLVARGFILRYLEAAPQSAIPLFVTLATPWGGHQAAARGVQYAPAVVRSGYDMAPDSRYVRELFYQDPTPCSDGGPSHSHWRIICCLPSTGTARPSVPLMTRW